MIDTSTNGNNGSAGIFCGLGGFWAALKTVSSLYVHQTWHVWHVFTSAVASGLPPLLSLRERVRLLCNIAEISITLLLKYFL